MFQLQVADSNFTTVINGYYLMAVRWQLWMCGSGGACSTAAFLFPYCT